MLSDSIDSFLRLSSIIWFSLGSLFTSGWMSGLNGIGICVMSTPFQAFQREPVSALMAVSPCGFKLIESLVLGSALSIMSYV